MTHPDDREDPFADRGQASGNSLFRLFNTYGRKYPHILGVALVANLLSPVINLAPAYIFGVAIDTLFTDMHKFTLPLVPEGGIPPGQAGQLYLAVGLIVGASALSETFGWAQTRNWALFAKLVQHDVRVNTYEKAQRLGIDFYEVHQTGQLMSIVNGDVDQLNQFLNQWMGQTLSMAASVVGILAIMSALNWQLTLVALIPIPVVAGLSYYYVTVVRPKYQDARQRVGSLNARIENNFSGIGVIKAYAAEDFEHERVRETSRKLFDSRWDAIKIRTKHFPVHSMVIQSGFALLFLAGGYWVLFGPPLFFTRPLTVGTFVTFALYSRRLTGPVRQTGWQLTKYERSKAAADRVFGLMDYPVDIPEKDDAVDLEGVRGEVEYDDVVFGYEDDEGTDPALDGVSFTVDPGEYVGIVGPTGSGKTTLVKLLLRLYDVDEGSIWIDGRNVRNLTLDSLRNSFGYVSQDPFLFYGSVAENIAYGQPDARRDEVERVARMAGAHEFIEEFDDGYDTQVGERGVKLSGGQRQRVALARAILKDPEILILDEATSHVDNETEVLIQHGLRQFVENRTTFAIAHRLSTVRNADTILVLDDGEVVERGTHDELLASDGLYANLWHVQVGEVEALPEEFVKRAALNLEEW